MSKLISVIFLILLPLSACGAGSNPNPPKDPAAGKGGKWGCYIESSDLIAARFKDFDLAMAGCIEEELRTGAEHYVMGPDKVRHPVDPPPQDLVITPPSFPTGTIDEIYPATTLEATGGEGPYDWEIASGSLPPGMILTVDGTVQGTPISAVGSPFTFRVAVTDINGVTVTDTFSITILGAPPTITTTSLPGGNEGTAYSATILAEGGNGPFTYSVTSGNLPPGLSLGTDGRITGTVGLVDGDRVYSFDVTATDSASRTTTSSLSISIVAALDLTVTTSSLPTGDEGLNYSSQLTSAGGEGSVSWTIVGGSLPPGLALSADGLITGLATAAGSYGFTVEAQDTIGQTATDNFTIEIYAAPPEILTTTLPNGQVGTAYSSSITWTSGAGPGTIAVSSGVLPPGISLGAFTGGLSGTPTESGVFTFSVTIVDDNQKSDTQALSIEVAAAPLAITTSTLPSGRVNDAYSASLSATGGDEPYEWAMFSGSLPPGLDLSPDGAISGTPISNEGSPFLFQVSVASVDGQSIVKSLEIAIDAMALSALVPAALPDGTVNSQYAYQLNAQGGETPYTWSIIQGTLPPGLSLSNDGVISGTPTSNPEPQYVITVEVTDSLGQKSQADTSIVVLDDSTPTPDATLSWTPPTEREDNTPLDLTEIGGYRVFARPSGTTEWTITTDVPDRMQNWYEFYGLAPGVWEFAATCYDVDNLESELSVIVSKEIIVE